MGAFKPVWGKSQSLVRRFGLWELLKGFGGGGRRILVPGGGQGGPDQMRASSETAPGGTGQDPLDEAPRTGEGGQWG